MQRREHWEILGLLLSLMATNSPITPLPPSRLAQRANLPYDRFVTYVEELRERGLISHENSLSLTPAGHEFLKSWHQWQAVLHRFGLD